MRAHPVRRTVLTCVATVTVTVLALSLKPHHPPSATAPPPTTQTPGATSGGSTSGTRTVTGPTVQTRYGPVQVELTLDGSRITAAHAVRSPNGDSHSREINASAVPVLDREALNAQSAHIDTVSGATYTSEGYVGSLQAALDQSRT